MSLDNILIEIKTAAIKASIEKIDEKIKSAEKVVVNCNMQKEKNVKEFNNKEKVEYNFKRIDLENGKHKLKESKIIRFNSESDKEIYNEYLLANGTFDQRISEVRTLILQLNELKDKIAALNNIDEPFPLLNKGKEGRLNTEKAKTIEKSKETITEIVEKRSPKRGELKELCIRFANELVLVKGKSLSDEHIEKVAQLITKEGIIANLGSIGAKLRDLGYKKEKH